MTANITRTIEEIKEEAILQGELKDKLEEKIEIAKKMLIEGMDRQVVANLTGLEVGRVE